MGKKQEAGDGLCLPWLVLLGTHRLLPRVVALCLLLPAVPAPWATAILLQEAYREEGGRRTQLAPGVRRAVAHRESV